MSAVEELVRILMRFDRPAPRYTSYPPANHFHDLSPELHAAALTRAASLGAGAPLSLYAHLPFCNRRCAYCGCHSVLGQGREAVAAYLDAMAAEAAAVAGRLGERKRVGQLQWGGGTPNYLTPEEMARCFALFDESFDIADDAEIGVELDPASLTREQLQTLQRLGFNRISLGVQDLDAEVQRLIGRGQTEEETRRAYAMCREIGFPSVHLDLVYGLPGQTRETLRRTLSAVVELAPDRLSLFGFAFLPKLRPNQAKMDASRMPDPTQRAYLYAESVELLTAAGYERIGMDHFARPGDELCRAQAEGRLHRNFQGYTTLAAPDLLGFGISAISDVAGCYAQSAKEIPAFQELAHAQGLTTERGFVLSADDLARRDVVNALMCNSEVRFAEIEARHAWVAPFVETFAPDLARLAELQQDGIVTVSDEAVTLSDWAWPLVRLAGAAFDAYLHGTQSGPDKPKYSQVV